MTVWDKAQNLWSVAGALVLLGLGMVFLKSGNYGYAGAAGAASGAWYWFSMRRSLRRRRIARRPFPAPWRTILTTQVVYYAHLSPERQQTFERDVALFIAEHPFFGVDALEVTDELKVLAAASAMMLIFNRPDLEYPRISEIIFYPGAFGDSFATHGPGRNTLGMNHPYGAIVLSAPDLRRSFEARSIGFHLGLHEFAHALDRSGMEWDGLPTGMDSSLSRKWSKAEEEEMEKIREGQSVLDPYAGTNSAEFFAVATVMFFEQPVEFRLGSPVLYSILEQYFSPAPFPRS